MSKRKESAVLAGRCQGDCPTSLRGESPVFGSTTARYERETQFNPYRRERNDGDRVVSALFKLVLLDCPR